MVSVCMDISPQIINLQIELNYLDLVKMYSIFRWFKFTLEPPYNIACGKLQLAIWDTFFWTFFGQIWTQGALRHILGPILVIFKICKFLMIPGSFEYF